MSYKERNWTEKDLMVIFCRVWTDGAIWAKGSLPDSASPHACYKAMRSEWREYVEDDFEITYRPIDMDDCLASEVPEVLR